MPSDGEKFKHLNKTSQDCETALKSQLLFLLVLVFIWGLLMESVMWLFTESALRLFLQKNQIPDEGATTDQKKACDANGFGNILRSNGFRNIYGTLSRNFAFAF